MAGVKGRGSAGHAAVVAIVVAVGLLAMAPGAFAATYLVGGSTQQWNFARNGYSYDTNWSALQTFHVNDVLEFKYTGAHDVVQYATKAEYDACAGAIVQQWTGGDDLVILNSTGTKYYICSITGHCSQGMKVSVNVVAAATPPTTTPTPAPTTPSPPVATTPPPPPAVTSPAGSAASSGPILSMAGLLAAALVAGLACLV